jgi:hypothetical protein
MAGKAVGPLAMAVEVAVGAVVKAVVEAVVAVLVEASRTNEPDP